MAVKKIKLKDNEFEVEVDVGLPYYIRDRMLRQVTFAHWGKETCNVYDESGRMVKDPEMTDEQEKALVDKHFSITCQRRIKLLGTVDINTGDITYTIYEEPKKSVRSRLGRKSEFKPVRLGDPDLLL